MTMNFIKTSALSDTQIHEIHALLDECKKKDPSLRLSFPFEDGTLFYLLYDPNLVSVLALTMPDPDSSEAAECVAFTLPEKRQNGYFSMLFEEAEKEIENTDLLFLTDHSNEGAEKTLESLGAEPEFSEYKMEKILNPADSDSITTKHSKESYILTDGILPEYGSPLFCTVSCIKDHTLRFTFFDQMNPDSSDAPCGSCQITWFENHVCFYAFEIEPSFRKKGFGKEALTMVLSYLKKQGAVSVFLHVSGENLPAVSLYQKTGFHICETLSYYLY